MDLSALGRFGRDAVSFSRGYLSPEAARKGGFELLSARYHLTAALGMRVKALPFCSSVTCSTAIHWGIIDGVRCKWSG